jgi:hypothetical protein
MKSSKRDTFNSMIDLTQIIIVEGEIEIRMCVCIFIKEIERIGGCSFQFKIGYQISERKKL